MKIRCIAYSKKIQWTLAIFQNCANMKYGHFWIYQCTLYTFFLSKKQQDKNLNSLTSQRGMFWGLSLCTLSWAFKNSFFQLFRFVFLFVPQLGYTKLFLKRWIHFLFSHWWATVLSLLTFGLTKSQRPSFKK